VAEAAKIHQSNANAAIIHPSAANTNCSHGSTGLRDWRTVCRIIKAKVSTTANSAAPAILPASTHAGLEIHTSARVRTVSAAAIMNRLRDATSGRQRLV